MLRISNQLSTFKYRFEVFSQDCGGYLNDSRGLITYQSSNEDPDGTVVDCFWMIETETGKEIEFEIDVLETQESFPCKDYLLVSKTSLRSTECIEWITMNSNYKFTNLEGF